MLARVSPMAKSDGPRPPAQAHPGARLSAVTVDPAALAEDLTLEDVQLSPAWADADASFAALMGIRMDAGTLAGSRWYRGSIVDSVLDGVDLANAAFEECGLRRCELVRCRLTGLDLSGCQLEDVTLRGCTLDLANLRFPVLTRVRFEDCSLVGADLLGAKLTDVVFCDCVLREVDVNQAACQRVRFERCDLEGLKGVGALRGATIDPLDLLALTDQLAAALGIRIARDAAP